MPTPLRSFTPKLSDSVNDEGPTLGGVQPSLLSDNMSSPAETTKRKTILSPSSEIIPKKKIRRKGKSKEIQIPAGCESIKAELKGLNSLPKNQFTESAYRILSDKSTYTLKDSRNQAAYALILYRINFPGDYKSENLIDQIETAMRLKFQNIQDIEILHKLICLRLVRIILIACRIILAYCPSHPIVMKYMERLSYMKKHEDRVY